MHGGRVVVESRVGSGSRFSVTLPRDPRLVAGTPAAERADVASAAEAEARATVMSNVQETSPSERSQVNPKPAP
jgi:acyl-CoA reductase-like NAD-dependent aldehyde dehydrogenase